MKPRRIQGSAAATAVGIVLAARRRTGVGGVGHQHPHYKTNGFKIFTTGKICPFLKPSLLLFNRQNSY